MFLVKGRWYTGFLAMASLGTQQRGTYFSYKRVFFKSQINHWLRAHVNSIYFSNTPKCHIKFAYYANLH